MIYLFSGDDTKTKFLAYEKFLKTFGKNVEVFSITKNDFNPIQIESFYSGAGLFFEQCVVVFKNILEKEEVAQFLFKKLALMSKSGNIFIFLEGKLKKADLDIFKKSKAELNIFELPKETKERYDSFILARDFERRDKLNLWIHYREALDKEVGMEEISGILFWKAKDMLVKKNFGKFTEDELKDFTSKISYLLPEARKRGLEDEEAFEQFLLEAF